MSATTADRATPTDEPLQSLLDAIAQARQIPELTPYEGGDGDPLARLRRTMRGEGELAEPELAESAASSANPASANQPGTNQPATSNSPSGDLDAVVGREVLALLRSQPLDGSARAAAVELLAGQLDSPDPQALRDLLSLLVTGRRD